MNCSTCPCCSKEHYFGKTPLDPSGPQLLGTLLEEDPSLQPPETMDLR